MMSLSKARKPLQLLATMCMSLAIHGCATIDYAQLKPGGFKGSVIVLWVAEGGSSGDGKFLFVPDPNDPLTFTRADPSSPGGKIRPRLMYTDGGSIPRIAQVFNGLSPWGYAPAYMVHDWLFVARHCLVDGAADSRHEETKDVAFEDSAAILGEAIQGLVAARKVKRNDVAASAITGAVETQIARSLWDKRGACVESQVRPEHVAAANAAIPGSVAVRGRLPEIPAHARAGSARIVSKMTF